MDDYKRQLYMLARAEIVKLDEMDLASFVCVALRRVVRREGFDLDIMYISEGLFQEFDALFDGSLWVNGERQRRERQDEWWVSGDTAARLRALDCILRD